MTNIGFLKSLKKHLMSKPTSAVAIDLLLMLASMVVSALLTVGSDISKYSIMLSIWFAITAVFYATLYLAMRMHLVFWRFASVKTFIKYFLLFLCTSILSMCVVFIVSNVTSLDALPIGTYIVETVSAISLLLLFRLTMRAVSDTTANTTGTASDNSEKSEQKNVMVVGCGYTGNYIINDILRDTNSKLHVACIIDDDPGKIGKMANDIPIVGGCDSIMENARKYDISLIIFAISTIDKDKRARILDMCVSTGCHVRTAPSIAQVLRGDYEPHQTRDINIDDLLGREPINIAFTKILDYINDKTILVTGGGGSIGSELCRQIASHNPRRLIIFDIYENNAYDIQNELRHTHPELDLVTLIGSVRDSSRLDLILEKYKPDIIYHAAAHKHVPLMEDSPNEAIKNNVLGTFKLARAADKHNVKRFVMISTDKAVNPTNIMGATKRICEMIVQSFNKHSNCEFVAVRFGNVLGSNGSVIPLFKKQIENGGPVTVTHPDIIRYFMTIPEAVSLVLLAGANAKGGEIFVLDMGKPVKILDLAKNLIMLMGHTPDGDIKIEFTGLRPGEKLYEELLMAEEGLTGTENDRIHIGKPLDIDEKKLFDALSKLEEVMYDDSSDVRGLVKELVPTYTYVS